MATISLWHRARRILAAGLTAAICAPGMVQAASLGEICDDCEFEKWATCGQFLEGINFDANGHGWAVSVSNGEIVEIVDGVCTVRATTGGKANGARFHKDGRLFIADQIRGVLTYDTATNEITTFADTIGGEPMVLANDLVFDENGGLYVTVPGISDYVDRTGQVIYFAPGSNEAQVVMDKLPYGNGIAIHPGGKYISIGLFRDKTIVTLPAAPYPQTFRGPYVAIVTDGGIGPDGIAMDTEGRTYWANFNSGAVGITDTRGFVLGYARLPDEAGLFTTNLAFHEGYLYVTEATKGEVWRMKVKTIGQKLYHQQ